MSPNATIKDTHISEIRAGHTVLCKDGLERTVGAHNIKRGGFCGTTLWGDSYASGTEMVKRILYTTPTAHGDRVI